MIARLAGRRVLITGAASGIGLATAVLFASEGASDALLGKDATGLATAVRDTGGIALLCDLVEQSATEAAVGASAMDGIDGVVNCAGIAGSQPLAGLDRESWDRFVAINLTAPYLLCRARRRPRGRRRPEEVPPSQAGTFVALPQ